MKFLHEGQGSNCNHIAQMTVRAVRLAKATRDDVQFSFNNVPVVVNENTVPKAVTPLYDAARISRDYRLIDARKSGRKVAFKVAVASLAAMLLIP